MAMPLPISPRKKTLTAVSSSESRKAKRRKNVEKRASYQSRGTGVSPLSLLFDSISAVSTGRRPDMHVDHSARNAPRSVTLGESYGMLSTAPAVNTNAAASIGYEYFFFSMK